MARPPKPWFREDRGAWFVTLNGTRHNLGPDKQEAHRRFHTLMAAPPAAPPPAKPVGNSVAAVLDRFLDWVEIHRSPDTYRWYKDRLQAFLNFAPKGLLVTELKPFHVQQWIDTMPHKSGTKRNYVRAVKRAMLWAEEQGITDRSPIAHLRKPRGGKRDNVIPPEDHAKIVSLTRDECFRDLCHFCYLTGARCAEAIAVEARHLDLGNHRVVFPVDEEKMERIPRIIYLGDEAEAILRRLAAEHPEGCLFRNTDGIPWTPDATNCRFGRLAKKIGRKVCLTDYRHSFGTRLLTAGVDSLTVSLLMGHADTSMLSKVYAHINHDHSYLLSAARKAMPASDVA
jgi:integrase